MRTVWSGGEWGWMGGQLSKLILVTHLSYFISRNGQFVKPNDS